VGYGLDREAAEKNALGALVSIFGQSVQGEVLTRYQYSEAIIGTGQEARESSDIDSAVRTSFAMNTLIGAEIKDRWFDERDTHYAIAVMDRNQAGRLYRGLIQTNDETILKLTDIPGGDINSLDAYTRYIQAGDIADASAVFRNVLLVLSPGMAPLLREDLSAGDDFRLAAREIAQNIPIGLELDQDPEGRIGAAFNEAIAGAGFRTGGGSRYTLEVAVSLADVDLPQNSNVFIRYGIDARLRDRAAGQVLFSYTASGREGHATRSEAVNRALRIAEGKIREEFSAAFNAYLARLSPKPD
jgi:hypothetical protein